MKKRYAVLALLIVTAVSAGAFTVPGFDSSFDRYDAPVIDGINYFVGAARSFSRIAALLGKLLGVVCIVWNAFRLWIGTEQVKKACVDVVTKFMIFTTLYTVYPHIVDGVLDTATKIGMTSGQGVFAVADGLATLYRDLRQRVGVAQGDLLNLINGFTNKSKTGLSAMSEASFKAIMGIGVGWDEGAALALLKSHGIEVVTDAELEALAAENNAGGFGATNMSYEIDEATGEPIARRSYADVLRQQHAVDKAITEKALKAYTSGGSKSARDAAITLKALDEVLTTISTDRGVALEKITAFGYKATIEGTSLLSPGSMIKTAALVATIMSRRSSIDYVEKKTETEKDMGFVEKIVHNTTQSLLHFILSVLFTFGLIASTIFFAVQYTMCIFEYFIVTSIGVMFVPFCLWDGTKSFTAKLVTLFSAYFIKIMVSILCIFWVFGVYMRMANNIMTEDIGIYSFAYFMFVCLLGFVVTQNAPQIAVTILNGSPQLSLGEFMQGARTIAGAAAGASRAAKAGGGAVQSAGRGTATATAGAVGAARAGVQAFKAANERGDSFAPAAGATAGFGSLAKTIGGGMLNSAAKMLTGQETRSHKQGISVGGSTGSDGKALTLEESFARALGKDKDSRKDEDARNAEKNAKPAPETAEQPDSLKRPPVAGAQKPLMIS
jgi:type IV secretion system protein TrbL